MTISSYELDELELSLSGLNESQRYELIAQVVSGRESNLDTFDNELDQIWDSDDISVDMDNYLL